MDAGAVVLYHHHFQEKRTCLRFLFGWVLLVRLLSGYFGVAFPMSLYIVGQKMKVLFTLEVDVVAVQS
jgi:hypothetical protein